MLDTRKPVLKLSIPTSVSHVSISGKVSGWVNAVVHISCLVFISSENEKSSKCTNFSLRLFCLCRFPLAATAYTRLLRILSKSDTCSHEATTTVGIGHAGAWWVMSITLETLGWRCKEREEKGGDSKGAGLQLPRGRRAGTSGSEGRGNALSSYQWRRK